MSNQIQLRERASYSYCAYSRRQQTNPSRKTNFIFHALQTSRVLHISMNARWRMNQLLICFDHPEFRSYLVLEGEGGEGVQRHTLGWTQHISACRQPGYGSLNLGSQLRCTIWLIRALNTASLWTCGHKYISNSNSHGYARWSFQK